jgi:hypothetical protein
MKSERIKVAEWLGDYTDGYVDIPWPEVQRQAGQEIIKWVNSQSEIKAQLILEKTPDAVQSLWIEFYDHSLRIECALRFSV